MPIPIETTTLNHARPERISSMDSVPIDAAGASPPLEPDDYYLDGAYMVFTAAYHLKRGYCCNSGCRHCPFRPNDAGETASI
jgi:hypothetical protein